MQNEEASKREVKEKIKLLIDQQRSNVEQLAPKGSDFKSSLDRGAAALRRQADKEKKERERRSRGMVNTRNRLWHRCFNCWSFGHISRDCAKGSFGRSFKGGRG